MTDFAHDFIFETSTDTGTGALDLDGAFTTGPYGSAPQAFLDRYSNGDPAPVTIVGESGACIGQWQTAFCTVNSGSPPTLSRTVVLDGSDGVGVAVDFAAGTKHVFVGMLNKMLGWQDLGSISAASAPSVAWTDIETFWQQLLVRFLGVTTGGTVGNLNYQIHDGTTYTTARSLVAQTTSTTFGGSFFIPDCRAEYATGLLHYGSGITGASPDAVAGGNARSANWRVAGGVKGIQLSDAGGNNWTGGSFQLLGRL